MSDRRIIYTSAFLRAFATGLMGVTLGLLLPRLFVKSTVDLIVGAGLGGAALAALIVTLLGDRLGRKQTLVALSVVTALGAGAVGLASTAWAIGAMAFVGMLNGMGRDRGAALILEQTMLPATTTDDRRTGVFAVYNILQDAGHALGGLAAGVPAFLHRFMPGDETTMLRGSICAYVAVMLAAAIVSSRLSRTVEVPQAKSAVSPSSRRILWKLSFLFGLDSLGGGFLTKALLTFFFVERFDVKGDVVAALFFAASLANAASHVGAAWLAKRIGLVNTMVFTHIPSSLLLASVPFAPSFPIAAVLFLLREGLVEMDVPTRQSYVMAVLRPEERTVGSGVTHLVRLGGWAAAPLLAGAFFRDPALPLYCGAGMKIVYDVLLYASFKNVKPPEEA